jgi:prophage maintenance system killer protein
MSDYGDYRGEVILFQAPDGSVELDVRLERESLWLSQRQMALLFDKDTDTIGLHLRNVFSEGELEESATTEESSVVQDEGGRSVRRRIKFYNLDAIISVGYRVNSRRGTQFRIWATKVLRDHLLQGFSMNAKRLKELSRTIQLVSDMTARKELSGDEATALLRLVGEYGKALDLLDDYDHQRIKTPPARRRETVALEYEEALRLVGILRDRSPETPLFGVEKDKGLASALGAVMQTAGGAEVYPGLEEKAANLLYFLVKNHAFVDGNKRIGAALFLWFLERNGILDDSTGKRIVSDSTLVAVTLMIAESRMEERELLVAILVNLLYEGEGVAQDAGRGGLQ